MAYIAACRYCNKLHDGFGQETADEPITRDPLSGPICEKCLPAAQEAAKRHRELMKALREGQASTL